MRKGPQAPVGAPGARKAGMDSFWSLQTGTQTCWYLDLGPAGPTLGFCLPELPGNRSVLVKAPKSVLLCSSSSEKPWGPPVSASPPGPATVRSRLYTLLSPRPTQSLGVGAVRVGILGSATGSRPTKSESQGPCGTPRVPATSASSWGPSPQHSEPPSAGQPSALPMSSKALNAFP